MNYAIRIEYSQNGRLISDSLFRIVPFLWKKQDETDAREAAYALVKKQGCGSAAIYICPVADNGIKTYISTNMHYPAHTIPVLTFKTAR
jgi:hypothetical protein